TAVPLIYASLALRLTGEMQASHLQAAVCWTGWIPTTMQRRPRAHIVRVSSYYYPLFCSCESCMTRPAGFRSVNPGLGKLTLSLMPRSIFLERHAHARLKYFASEAGAYCLRQLRLVAPRRDQEACNRGDEFGFRHDDDALGRYGAPA